MRGKILIGACCLLVGAGAMFLITGGAGRVAADCPGPPGEPCGNGDCNADGQLNIADAMHLLTYLFLEGPPPAALECVECFPCRLPATGQTLCYNNSFPVDENGNVIDCAGAEFPGQDGLYRAGCSMEGRFVDNGDGTVTDNCTGLTWQQATPDAYTWGEALQYCEDLELGGHDDWRLPNVRELQSIVDYGRADPAIDPVFSARSEFYWSSSSDVHLPDGKWHVHFRLGYVTVDDETNASLFLRAVRGGL